MEGDLFYAHPERIQKSEYALDEGGLVINFCEVHAQRAYFLLYVLHRVCQRAYQDFDSPSL